MSFRGRQDERRHDGSRRYIGGRDEVDARRQTIGAERLHRQFIRIQGRDDRLPEKIRG